MIYPDHRVVAVEENDIDREAHEEHMHPHERLYTAANEEHPFARFEACSPEQATALARRYRQHLRVARTKWSSEFG